MLSFSKSHAIEGLIRFQFISGKSQVFKGQRKSVFISNIQHKLSRYRNSTMVVPTDDSVSFQTEEKFK